MNVLGISCHYHDSGAALVRDGRLIAAAEEERFNRIKHYNDFPEEAIAYCLREGGIAIDEVDYIGFYEKPFVKFNRILETILQCWPRTYKFYLRSIPSWVSHKIRMGHEIQKRLGGHRPLLYCQHHLSHAASAFLVSPFEQAAIISADGVGEWTTTAYGVGRGNRIELQHEIKFPHSIGLLFSAITAYLGFRVNDAEWKVMGLAPYGKPTYLDQFRQIVDLKDDGSFRLNLDYFAHTYSPDRIVTRRWETLFGQPPRNPESDLTDFHRDIAHSGQKIVEDIMVTIARHVRAETGMKKVCLAGGVALNCVANWRILQEAGFDEIFIQPAAGDSGGALGTAFYIYNTVLDQPRSWTMHHAAWGPGFEDDAIRAYLDRVGARYEHVANEDELLNRTAATIADGRVVAWFQGRMEFGPRALGARSLLADPRRDDMKDIINAKVKFREAFRPFAPAVLKEHAHEYFEMAQGMDAPFMLLVPSVVPEKRSQLPAVTHADGTGRVQTLTDEHNGRFYRLVRAFGDLTGVPVLLNTSFNVRGEPIVCTPRDAYNTFVNTGIDVLVMGPYIVEDKPDAVDYAAGMERSVRLESAPTGQQGADRH